jgi:hypothetical protein
MSEEFNRLLLNLGISTSGLAFGLCVPVFFRLMKKSLLLRHVKRADLLSWVVMGLIALSTLAVIVFKEHVTARRLFLLIATTSASIALWLVRNVGCGKRAGEE